MALPTAEEIKNLYLYGVSKRLQNLLDPSLSQPRAGVVLSVDVNDYMSNGTGRYADVAGFDFIADFFGWGNSMPPEIYTKSAAHPGQLVADIGPAADGLQLIEPCIEVIGSEQGAVGARNGSRWSCRLSGCISVQLSMVKLLSCSVLPDTQTPLG